MNLIKKILVAPAAALFVLAGAAAQAATDDAVAARLKPVGEVCIKGQECAAAAAAAPAEAAGGSASAAAAGRSGDDIVAKSCGVCHGTGLLDAPKTGDKEAWAIRAEAGGGMDGLLAVAKSGRGGMPPMGTCGDCSDDELISAIKAMSGL
ncbi:c-type cytochrome [Thiopseudomonas denitrificans]|uniref:Cytochrome c5 n=1 Tax=Thiopseudomonas denitrificans TaxID=1501432 RepID=A0A4R6TYC6_9GAMM|nr:c-type cytochrome [Thiopseudomonas denitrificans]TDQ37029.1 cytochrome c5 [Thiopseudomonas denitrificans]